MPTLVDTGLTTLLAMHDAFRRDTGRLVAALAALAGRDRSEAASPADAAAVQTYWETFLAELHDHHRVEDDEVYPQVEAVLGAPATVVVAAMSAQHATLTDALDATAAAIAALSADPTPDAAARALAVATRLSEVVTGHLDDEESRAVPLIRAALDEPFMATFLARRQAEAVPPRFLPWVLDGADAPVVAHFTGQLPPPVASLLAEQWRPARQALVDALPTP
ncbi:MAG: Hemerythrin cation binding domain protein [Acidimicrobiales bacterium]|nr:Hemerythrin cation binding domain protein [Acidimicrobiales bacterium]